MKDRKVMIYAKDAGYAAALSGFINRDEECSMISQAVSDPHLLMPAVGKARPDILLTEEYPEEALREGLSARIVLLTRTREGPEGREGLPWIFQYQSARTIVQELEACWEPGGTSASGEEASLYVVFSARAGTERSRYAGFVCRQEARGGPVLYVDMTLFSGKLPDGERNLSDFLYFIKQGEDSASAPWSVRQFIRSYGDTGIDIMAPAVVSLDLAEITAEDMRTMIAILRDLRGYRRIVVELGFYSAAALELIRQAGRVDLVLAGDGSDSASAESFLRELSSMPGGLEKKIQRVRFEQKRESG